jgi:hypothetical protein
MKDYYTTKRQKRIKCFTTELYNQAIDYIIESRPVPEKLMKAING